MSISKNHIKLISSLQQKKYRQKYNLFVVEGVKVVAEFLNSEFELDKIFTTEDYLLDANFEDKKIIVSEKELQKVSQLKAANKVLAIFKKPKESENESNGLIVVLDAINDPGNLGTIIRLCDWFGVKELICSIDTVDCFNNKVVQASMGSLTRLGIKYLDLKTYLNASEKVIFIADMDGENVYQSVFPEEGVLIMGNEANGVSEEIKKLATRTISIPRFGEVQKTESLNVATATAILLSEFKRRV